MWRCRRLDRRDKANGGDRNRERGWLVRRQQTKGPETDWPCLIYCADFRLYSDLFRLTESVPAGEPRSGRSLPSIDSPASSASAASAPWYEGSRRVLIPSPGDAL